MDPIIWAAVIARGVSVIGNVATGLVAWFGRDAQREQVKATTAVEVAKIGAESERIRDQRIEDARRERREFYGRPLAVISRLEAYDIDDPGELTDSAYLVDSTEYGQLVSEAFLVGTEAVQDCLSDMTDALADIATEMHRFEGGPAAQFRAASREGRRGHAVTTTKGRLISAMRDDVTAPHLPEPTGE